ncbi:hypothetical protein KK448_004106 [Salmonella enterica]|uniref:Uncharacterized protein n=2 Tax=Salmonella enterica I TaxID=59201 RepID=A0A5U9VNJ6_SALNE|nr:hypothetical protein [Salmonella enterica]EBS4547601.1 hypothetical protein [Salmonella enterica subsp. enterica serovar Newport]EBS6067774.1 hypothetical protein [Salmonella enterica subsp. enterica serovar Abony]EBH5154303.1 hypothetical protein [Salmonella enterica]EBO5191255.1 hypothetical protein [Salmonella enterica]
MINILFALFSILAGILLAEIAYVFLLIIEYMMLGSFNFELTSAWHYLKVGTVGGGIMGIGIALFRYFGVKGF